MEREGTMVVDCRPLQEKIKHEIKEECTERSIKPVLAIIRVGEDFASGKYIAQKIKHGKEAGLEVIPFAYSDTIDYETLRYNIAKLNNTSRINGIIIQLPLPIHLAPFEQDLLDCIDPIKDVDCMTTLNIGKLAIGTPLYKPCTPQGIIDILDNSKIDLTGKSVAIIGRSNIVGKPLIQLLLERNAQVSIYHSYCNVEEIDMFCDVIISAVGSPKRWTFKNSDDTILIDVGINFDKSGKMCGDMDLEHCTYKLATPVPNGVGRMTVSALLKNTLLAYKLQNKLV